MTKLLSSAYVPIEPFREWIKQVQRFYSSDAELNDVVGMAWDRFKAIRDDSLYWDSYRKESYRIEKISIKQADKAMSADGRFHLVEFYPEVYND